MSQIAQMIIPAMIAGFVLDQIVGDPYWLYHPVRLIGNLIDVLHKRLRQRAGEDPAKLRNAGRVLVLITTLSTVLVTALLVGLSYRIHPRLCLVVMTLLDYWLFAVKSLKVESMKVYDKLMEKDLAGARQAVSMIVGRDTQNLSESGVAKAAIETVAESTSDGVIAPMIFMAIGGPVLGWLYKSINTMDSMVGYKDEKYLHIGRAAALLDDVVNFLPSRLSGILMVLSCPLAGLDVKEAWRIFKRDRHNHASPNSAQTESVMAGALRVQLAGDAYYFGKLYRKPTIGDPIRSVETEDIRRANKLMYATSYLSIIVLALLREWLLRM